MAKKWVKMKYDYMHKFHGEDTERVLVEEGSIGFILPNVAAFESEWRLARTNSARDGIELVPVKFPQTHGWSFPVDALEELPVIPVDEAIEIIREYEGHHSNKRGEFQFNIKMYHYPSVPEEVKNVLSERQIDSIYQNALEDNLRCLVDKDWADGVLSDDFDWVHEKKWHTAGRMGGWLVLNHRYQVNADGCEEEYEEHREYVLTDLERMKDYVSECVPGRVDRKEFEERQRDLDGSLEELSSVEEGISDLARDLQMIDTIIERHKAGIVEYLSTMEPYEQYMPEFYAYVDYDGSLEDDAKFYVERRDKTSNVEDKVLEWFNTYEEAVTFANSLGYTVKNNVQSTMEAMSK